MARGIATNRSVDRRELFAFIRPRHHCVLITTRSGGALQTSLVTMGVDDDGRIVVSSYPERAKSYNLRRRPTATVCVMSDEFNGEWVQIDGTAEVIELPSALEPLCDYYRAISGEHPDWDGYRRAMIDQGKCLIRVTIEHWGPVAKGGFPARLTNN